MKEQIPLESDLIYDVGMHNGDDTAFYLAQGFRVLGIEADPECADKCSRRFTADVESGRLRILQVGVSGQDKIEKFWICETDSSWNSFDRSIASRDGCAHHSIEIQTQRFDVILKRGGIPIYLKIDIEGNDQLCLDALRYTPLPNFVSAEDQGIDEKTGLPTILVCMHEIGYRYFKLVSQRGFYCWNRPNLLDRVLNSAAYGRLRIPGISRIVEHVTYKNTLARRNGGHQFPHGSSGPWGDGIPGKWLTFEEACRSYSTIHTKYFSKTGVANYSFWRDWHAKVT